MQTLKFDTSPSADERGQFELIDDLNEVELEDAINFVLPYSKGVFFVTGPPGAGKDLFCNVHAWKNKTFIKTPRKVLRDEIPREPFGYYELFTPETIAYALLEMESDFEKTLEEMEVKRSKLSNKLYQFVMAGVAERWLDKHGEDLLRNSVLYLTEATKWLGNREPFNPKNAFMGQILRRWRHYDLLVLISTQLLKEMDKTTGLTYKTHEVRCSWSKYRVDNGFYKIYTDRTITGSGTFEISKKVKAYFIDGGLPRERLGGMRYFDLWNSKS